MEPLAKLIHNKPQLPNAPTFPFGTPILVLPFRKYLPLPPPPFPSSYPLSIRQFLQSRNYTMLPLQVQDLARMNIASSYRNFYKCQDIVEYLHNLTKLPKIPLFEFVEKYGGSADAVDWYRFVRKLYDVARQHDREKRVVFDGDKVAAAKYIQNYYREWRRRLAMNREKTIKEEDSYDRNIDENGIVIGLRQKFASAPESLKEMFKQIDKNSNGEISRDEFKQLLKQLDLKADQSTLKHVFKHFDKDDKDYFNYSEFVSFLFSSKVLKSKTGYLNTLQLILQEVCMDLRSYFANVKDFESEFKKYYEIYKEFSPETLSGFFEKLMKQKKYSRYQLQQVCRFVGSEKYMGRLYTWKLEDMKRSVASSPEKSIAMKDPKEKHLQPLIDIILFLLDKNDVKSQSYTKNEFLQYAKQSGNPGTLSLFFNLFKAINKLWPYYLNSRSGVCPISARLHRQHPPKQLREMHQQALSKYPESAEFTGKHLGMIIYETLQERMTELDYKALGVDLKGTYKYREVLNGIFGFSTDRIVREILRVFARKIYGRWRRFKRRNVRALNLGMTLLSQALISDPSEIGSPTKIKKRSVSMRSDKKSARSNSSISTKQKSEFEPDAIKIIYNIINGLVTKPSKTLQAVVLTRKPYLYTHKIHEFRYRTNLTHFSSGTLLGSIFMNDNVFTVSQNEKKQLILNSLLRPPHSILDFIANESRIFLLTSRLHVQIYEFESPNNYPSASIKLEQNLTLTKETISSLYPNRFYNKYPYLLKIAGRNLYVNATSCNNQIYKLDENQVIGKIKFSPNNYVINPFQQALLNKMKQNLKDRQIQPGRVIQMNQFPIPFKQFKRLMSINFPALQKYPDDRQSLWSLLGLTTDQVTPLQAYLLRTLISEQQPIKQLPDRYSQPHQLVLTYLKQNNLSLFQLLAQLDEKSIGYIPYRSFRNFLLKLTNGQEIEQTQEILAFIDSSGKIQYHNLCQFLRALPHRDKTTDQIKQDFIKVTKGVKRKLTRLECTQLFFPMFHYSQHDIEQFLETLTYDRNGCLDLDWFAGYCEPVKAVRLWEKWKCPVEDFLVIEDYELIVHTVVGSNYVFISDNHERTSKIIAVLKGHDCDLCPIFHYLPQSCILVTGDKHSQPCRPSCLLLWNLSHLLISTHSCNAPWSLPTPTLLLPNAHSDSLTCLAYCPQAGALITASADSTFKCWTYTRGELIESRRMYLGDMVCIGCEVETRKVLGAVGRALEKIVCLSVERVVNRANRHQIAAVAETYYVDNLEVEIAEESFHSDIPLKLKTQLQKLGRKICEEKCKAQKVRMFELQKQQQNKRHIMNSFYAHFYKAIKQDAIYNNDEKISKTFDWARQLFNGVSIGQLRSLLDRFGVKLVELVEQVGGKKEEQFQEMQHSIFRPSSSNFNLPVSILLPSIEPMNKQRLIQYLQSFQKQYLTYQDFNLMLHKVGMTENQDTKLYFELMSVDGKISSEKVLPISQVYKSFLRDAGNDRSPPGLLRKLGKHLKKKGMEAWQIFNKDKAKLAHSRYLLSEEFIAKVIELRLLSVEEANIISRFFEEEKGISLKRFIDCLGKALNYVPFTQPPSKHNQQRNSPRSMAHLQHPTLISPRQSHIQPSELARSQYSIRNASALSQLDPMSLPLDESLSKVYARPKNFAPLNYPRLAKYQEKLKNNQKRLKEIREKCVKEAVEGRVAEEVMKEVLMEDFEELEDLEELMKEMRVLAGEEQRIEFEKVLPKFDQGSNLQAVCTKIHEALKHNPLNVSSKEYMKIFKIEEITKIKLRQLLKKLKLESQIDLKMQQDLSSFIGCVRSISVDDFLRKIHPRKYPKPTIKSSTAQTINNQKDTILNILTETVQQAQDFNILQHIPFSILKNILINPKYQIGQSQMITLQDYLKKLRKQQTKFRFHQSRQTLLKVNLPLLFQQLSKFLNPPDTKSLSSSSVSVSKDSAPRDLRRNTSGDKITITQSVSSVMSQQSQKINDIVHRGQSKLKEKNKSIWQVLSMVNPDWMEGEAITKKEFFQVFDAIDPNLRLRDKVDLLRYCDRDKSGQVEIEMLLDAFENKNLQAVTEKFVLGRVATVLETRDLRLKKLIAGIFQSRERITPLEISQAFSKEPFNFPSFVLREITKLLMTTSKRFFDDQQDLLRIFTQSFKKHQITLTENTSDLIRQICSYLDQDQHPPLQQLFPPTQKPNLLYLIKSLQPFQSNQGQIQQLWKLLVDRNSPADKKITEKKMQSMTIPHQELVRTVRELIQQEQFSKARETAIAKRIYKAVVNRKLQVFEFYLLVDRTRKGSATELEFSAALRELGVYDNIWKNIRKRNPKWLTFSEFVHFLIEKQACQISVADTQLQVSMSLFIKKILKSQRIDRLFTSMSLSNNQPQQLITWQSFHKFLQPLRILKPNQQQVLFSAFVNADHITKSKLGNDALLKQEDNLTKGFAYRHLIKLYYHFARKNAKKTAAYKLYECLMKRRISLFQQMNSFMMVNRKNKEVAEALKNKELSLSREMMQQFLQQLNTGISQKDIKQVTLLFDQKIPLNQFQTKLQKIYSNANSQQGKQQVLTYSKRLYECIRLINSSTERLFSDFSPNNVLTLSEFNDLCSFIDSGLNKIQIKQVFTAADESGRGQITSYELNSLFDESLKGGEKAEEEVEFEEIVGRVLTNKGRVRLPKDRTTLMTDENFGSSFKEVLNSLEIMRLVAELRKKYGRYVDCGSVIDFMEKQAEQAESKTHRKARVAIKKILNFLADYGVTVKQWFRYFSYNNVISKPQFFTLTQTFPFKLQMDEIDDLFNFLDQARTQNLTLQALCYKVDVAVLSGEGAHLGTQQAAKLYYRTKVKLQEIYLHFVKKLFRDKQIHSYFDTNGTGEITGKQFLEIIRDIEIQLREDEKRKLVKYLAKDDSGNILISNLLKELKSCLPNQTKEILQTKIFQIFKQHQDMIQQQPDLFIDKLLDCEVDVKITDARGRQTRSKGIRQKDFFNFLKQFGILLNQDELQDVRSNFSLSKDQLDLCKIYQLIDSILSNISKQQKALQIHRYQKLLKYLKSNSLTFQQIQSVLPNHTAKSLTQLLISFNILRPIEVKRLVDPLIIPGTTQADLKIFKENLLASYYGEYRERQDTVEAEEGGELELSQKVKEQLLKTNSNPNFWVSELVGRGVATNREGFERVLKRSGVLLSKKEIQGVFAELADQSGRTNKSKVLSLLGNNTEPQRLIKKIEQVNENQHFDMIHQLFDHIAANLNFRGISLLDALRQCGCSRQGKCDIDTFILFTQRIGYQSSKQDILSILSDIPIHPLSIQHLQKLIIQMQIPLTHRSVFTHYHWLSKSICKLSQQFARNKVDPARFARQFADREEIITWEGAYSLLRKLAPKHQPAVRRIVHMIFREERIPLAMFLEVLANVMAENGSYHWDLDGHLLTRDQYCAIIKQSNIIRRLQTSITSLSTTLSTLQTSTPTLRGLRLLTYLLLHQHLLLNLSLFNPIPLAPPTPSANPSYTFHSTGQYQTQTLNIQQFQPIDSYSYSINGTHIGFRNMKLCDDRLKVEMVLKGNQVMYLAEGFYCVRREEHRHSSSALSFNWKCIPQFARRILGQIDLVNQHGYCLVNLRWRHLGENGIATSDYPAKIDHQGRVLQLTPIKYPICDPYTSPQLFYSQKCDIKSDIWCFACLLVQFIFGIPPQSLHQQLQQYLNHRQRPDNFDELPSNFRYLWLKDQTVKQLLSLQHCNEEKSEVLEGIWRQKSEDSKEVVKKLIKSLRVLYGHVNEKELEMDLEELEGVIGVVEMCFEFNPGNRPNVQELMVRFPENKNMRIGEVLQGLARAMPVKRLKEEFEKSADAQQVSGKARQMSRVEKQIAFILEFFVKNKSEYFPESTILLKLQGRNVQLSKSFLQKIEMSNAVRLSVQNGFINYLFNSKTFQKLIYEVNKNQNQQQHRTLHLLLSQMISHLTNYNSGLVYYTKQSLHLLLLVCFGQLTPFPSSSSSLSSSLSTLQFLQLNFNKHLKHDFLELYLRLIGENGQPSISYLPIYDAFTAGLQDYHQGMATALAIYREGSSRESVMARLEFLTMAVGARRQGYTKAVEDAKCTAYFVRFLKGREGRLREKALQFYCVLSELHPPNPIFHCQSLYLPLFSKLRSPDQTIACKRTSLQLFLNLLSFCDPLISSNLNSPCFSTINQLLKLSVQPKQGCPESTVYAQLLDLITQVKVRLREDLRVTEKMPGSMTILYS